MLSGPYALGAQPAPDEELVEAALELAPRAEASEVVAELSLVAGRDDEPAVEEPEAICVALEEPEPVVEA